MKCLIISGGSIDKEFLLDIVNKTEDKFIIAADRGVLYASDAGIEINRAIGDFDSVSEEEKQRIIDRYDTEVLIPEKDDTDTEHALKYALDLNPEEIILLGCTGSRLDQTFAAIRNLKLASDRGVSAYVMDKCNRIRVVKGEIRIKKAEAFGKYISIVPYGDKAEGITLKGMKYPLDNYTMTADFNIGISNEIVSDEAIILSDDYLIVMETID